MDSDLHFLNSRKTHTLNLGTSFQRKQEAGFHTLRYDFKPASVDKTKEGCIEVGEGNEVTLTLPHIAGSKTSCTVYKGSKKPVQKECFLIYDHDTGEFTLERISSQLQVKKTRMSGNIPTNLMPVLPPAQKVPKMGLKKSAKLRVGNKPEVAREERPVSPSLPKVSPKSSPVMTEYSERSPSPSDTAAKVSEEMMKAMNSDSQSSSSGSSNSSSDNSSSSSGSDIEGEDTKIEEEPRRDLPPPSINLKDDLQLSESSSSESD